MGIFRSPFEFVSFLIALNQHLPPHSHGIPANIKFTELDIPRALGTYAPSLAGIAGFFRPSQTMLNATRKEIAEAANRDPLSTLHCAHALHRSLDPGYR